MSLSQVPYGAVVWLYELLEDMNPIVVCVDGDNTFGLRRLIILTLASLINDHFGAYNNLWVSLIIQFILFTNCSMCESLFIDSKYGSEIGSALATAPFAPKGTATDKRT